MSDIEMFNDSTNISQIKTYFTTNKKNKKTTRFSFPDSNDKTITMFNNMDMSILNDENPTEITNKIICEKCYNIPQIIFDEEGSTILIICNICNINKYFSKVEFLDLYENNKICKNIICSICSKKIFNNNELKGKFCKECKKVVCFDCENNIFSVCKIQKHTLFPLSTISSICQKHNKKYTHYDIESKMNLCGECLSETKYLLQKENIKTINNNYNNDLFNIDSNMYTNFEIQKNKLDSLYNKFNDLIDKFKILINEFYEKEKQNILIQYHLFEESLCNGNACYNSINNRPNVGKNNIKYDIFPSDCTSFKEKFNIMVNYIFLRKIKSEVNILSKKSVSKYQDFQNIQSMLVPSIDQENKDKIYISDLNTIKIYNNTIFKELNLGISKYTSYKTNQIVKFKKIYHISEFNLKLYNSSFYKNTNSCLLLCEENGVMICVLNAQLSKIDFYLFLNYDKCIKSEQLSNGNILCLNVDGKLLIYEKNIIDEYLNDLFKNYYDYMDPINISSQKNSKDNNIRNYLNDIDDICDEDDFNDIYPYPPNCIDISNKIFHLNFLECNIDNNNKNILLTYGKRIFLRGGYSEESIFYTDITNINNINEYKSLITTESIKKYLLVHLEDNIVGFNFKKQGENYIRIINAQTMETLRNCRIYGEILDFNLNNNNNIIICYYFQKFSRENSLKSKEYYFIEEYDAINCKTICQRNLFESDEVKKYNIILLIKDDITYVWESKNLLIFK